MANEVDSFQWDLITKNFRVPFKIILAEKGALKNAKKYLNNAKVEKDLMIIKGATHYFNDREDEGKNFQNFGKNGLENL